MDAVRGEPDRGLHVVVHDERHRQLAEGPADFDELVGRRTFAAELHDGGASRDRDLRRLEVLDDRVQPHSTLARTSSVSGSRAASASYKPTWNDPGPCASTAASAAATPKATSASTAASSGASGRTARKQPVIAVAMQPVPVTVPSSSWPFAIAQPRWPSETWSTGPVTAATHPSTRAAASASSGPAAAPTDSTPRISAPLPARVAIPAAMPRTTAISSLSSSRRAVSVR